ATLPSAGLCARTLHRWRRVHQYLQLKYALEPRNVRSFTFTVPTPSSTQTLNPDMSEPLPAQQSADVKSPDSGISPRTVIQGSSAAPDYFPPPKAAAPAEAVPTSLATNAGTQDAQDALAPADAAGDTETQAQAPAPAPAPAQKPERPRIQIKGQDAALRPDLALQSPSGASIDSGTTVRPSESDGPGETGGRERKASISSLSFAPLHNPALPQGTHKKTDKTRIRASSPPPNRFQSHVAFDNLPLGEATKSNTPSLTLNVRHRGYQAKRRSRTFMVGVDEHAYSDYALQWLLDELVDDGDEVVCVRVVDKDMRSIGASYQDDAQAMMDAILEKNGANRAISVVLEYACGKLHSTFQKLIQIYQPAMLIVGTRGRSLGGLQGLVNTRNSFSKYCLQYSPIPVVVVRPTEKREKKKSKRLNDTERRTYVRMLSATGGKHEADSEKSSLYEVEVKYSADEEAHQVAKVLGLPASFDPTVKPLNPSALLRNRYAEPSPLGSQTHTPPTEAADGVGGAGGVPKAPAPPSTTGGHSDSDSDSDDDEFEVMPGEQALDLDQQEKLHDMEVGEAAALLKQNRRLSAESGNADDDDEGRHSRKSSVS
ncbi:hypothetical protein D7B24_004413, partial [Verticillium nonalfalfae]